MAPAAGLRAAALVAGLAAAGASSRDKGRRLRGCTDDDWQFTFTECTEDLAGYRSRAAFAYAPEEVCDPEARSSDPVPEPLLGLPCHQPCERGERLSIETVPHTLDPPWPSTQLAVRCKTCENGRFSLGGGQLVDGASGDWASTPMQLMTFCSYRGTDYQWHAGSGAPMVCMLRVSSSTPSSSSDDLATETRPGTWNGELPDIELDLAMVSAPGDAMACGSIEGESVRGKAVLTLRGLCAFSQKTNNLAAAGALAVVVYDNVPDAGYFYPAPEANASKPTIPIFMITNKDGLRWLDRLAIASDVRLRAATTRCSDARLEALPVGAGEGNSSAESLAEETWESVMDRLGCSPWVADPSGKFMHSGNNLHFHWLYSVLSIDVRFVRDGHLRFRYSVDAEDQFDGLVFLMDHVQQSRMISQEAPQGEWRVEVPRGSHTFAWMYTKDFAGTVGADQARLYLLEIVGDSFADEECRSCKGALLHGVHGAEACSGCDDGKYIDSDGSCKSCANGFWAPPGVVGEESCLRRLPCTDDDIEVTYSAFEVADGGARQPVLGEHCRRNESLVAYAWRRPQRCDPSLDGSAQLPEANPVVGPCPSCQPREVRPASGGDCEPKVPSCSAGEHPLRELSITSWQVWPANFSTEVFGLGAAGGDGGTSWGWRLAHDGAEAVVGTAGDGADAGEVDNGVARLHLDMRMSSAGNLTAFIRINPVSAWGRHAAFLVNGSRVSGERLEGPLGQGSPPLFRLVVPLPSGQQRVSWSWSAEGAAAGAGSLAADGGGALEETGLMGMRIVSVSVPHVEGAGALSCAGCPDGEEVASDGSSCQACPAGRARSASSGSSSCKLCPSGHAAEAGAAECHACGVGLRSSAGAARCEPRAFLEIENSLGGSAGAPGRRWSTEAILSEWSGLAASNRSGSLLPMRVEDRLFYFSALASPGAQPSAQTTAAATSAGAAGERLAYWWERLPPAPRAAATVGAGASVAVGAGAAADGVCEASGGGAAASFRAVGALLEGLVPAAEGELVGVWALFSSECSGDAREASPSRRKRAARLFMRCERPEPLLAIAAAVIMDSLGNSSSASSSSSLDVLQGSFFDDDSRPSSPHSCEDITVEWRTSAACPSCLADDFVPLASGPCGDEDGGQRQRMVYVSRVPCFGGAAPPQAYWAPCGDEGSPLNMVLAIVIPAVFIGCCLCCYVVMLKRRYAKYAMLEEEEGPRSAGRLADGSPSVPATSIGAPNSFA